MWKTCVAIVLCCSVSLAADEKPKKEPSDKEKREAAIKALKEKMAPLEKKLAENKEDLAMTKATPVNGKNVNVKDIGGGRTRVFNYRLPEQKQKDLDKYQATIDKLNEELDPLRAKLKELQKTPKPAP